MKKMNNTKTNHTKTNTLKTKQKCYFPLLFSLLPALLFNNSWAYPANVPKQSEIKTLNEHGDRIYNILAAETASLRGDFKTAIAHYQSIKNSQQDPLVLERIMNLAFQNKNEEQFERIAAQWVKIDGQNTTALEALAVTQIKNKNIDGAILSLSQLINQLQNKNENAYGFIFSGLKDFVGTPELIQIFDKLGALDPQKNGMGYFFAASIAADDNQTNDALRLIEKAILLNDKNIEFIQLKAQLLWRNNQIIDALNLLSTRYHTLAQDDPNKLASGIIYAKFLLQNFEYDKASALLQDINNTLPKQIDVLSLLFLTALDLQNYEDAQKLIPDILLFDPVKATFYQADLYKKQGQYEKLRSVLLQLNDSKSAMSRQLGIAESFLAEKNLLMFTAQLDALRGRFPDNQQSLYLQQAALLEKYEYNQEAYLLNSLLIQYYPDLKGLQTSKAMLALKLGRFDEFESIFNTQLEKTPNDANLLNGLGYTIFEQEKTALYPKAQKMMEKAYALVPDNIAVIDSMGWMYYQLGEYEKALDYLTIAFNQMKEPDVIVHYLAALIKNNRRPEAEQLFSILEKIHPGNSQILWFKDKILSVK